MSTQTATETQQNEPDTITTSHQNTYEMVPAASPEDTLAVSSADLRQASTDSIPEPQPSNYQTASLRSVHFTSNEPEFADTKRESNFSPNDVVPISITAPLSNPNSQSVPLSGCSPNETDKRVAEILDKRGGITSKSQTIRSLQYLQSLRVKDNLFHHPHHDGDGGGKSFFESAPNIMSTDNVSSTQYSKKEDLKIDDIEEINERLSQWSLAFSSTIREKQFRLFVTERYGTSIRVAILAMIVAYIFLAGTNGSFVKDLVRVVFVCLGLTAMLIIFSLSSSYSKNSSSATISYIKSLLSKPLETTEDSAASSADTKQSEQITSSETSTWSPYLHSLFACYSTFMMALCVLILLSLLILQNTIGGGSLSDDKFIVYYLLSLLVTSTYGSIGYSVYLTCAWTAWLSWNILAITMQAMEQGGPFDFSFVNISLIIGQLVMGHQVKAKDMARRKSFLRAMNHVHNMHAQSSLGYFDSSHRTPRRTPRRTPSTYAANYKNLDIVSAPSIRDRLSAAVLESVLDKSLGNESNNKRNSASTSANHFSRLQYGSATNSMADGSPMKRRRTGHTRKKSKVYADIKRELTRRGTEHIPTAAGRVSALGSKLGFGGKRDGNQLGIWGMIRGLGGNLSHLESHDEEEENEFIDTAHAIQLSSQLKEMSRKTSVATDTEEKETNADADSARVLATVTSQKILKDHEDAQLDKKTIPGINSVDLKLILQHSLTDEQPHCGSFHELPEWYSAFCDSYILTGYRVNYTTALCFKSIFQKHNETVNIWTEFLPAIALVVLTVYFNTESGHFWAKSDTHDSMTKGILYVAMPFIIVRPIISGLAHTFSVASKKAAKAWWKLDFLSIIVGAGFGSVIWIHCIFYCDKNLQTLYMFAVAALAFSTTMTALTTKNPVIRDLSLGAYFVFTLIFIYFYELFLLFLTNAEKNMPNSAMIYWTCCVSSSLSAVLFRASKFPEALFVKRRFTKLMEKAFDENFAITCGNNTEEYHTNGQAPSTPDQVPNVTDHKEQQASFKQQVSFSKMLHDIQSYTAEQGNKMAKIENLDNHLYDDPSAAAIETKKQRLEQEIENLENEIMNEIKNEIRVEQCMEMAYVELISEDRKQWFNYVFTSHNFWHIFMNSSVFFSYLAWREYFNWRAMEENWC